MEALLDYFEATFENNKVDKLMRMVEIEELNYVQSIVEIIEYASPISNTLLYFWKYHNISTQQLNRPTTMYIPYTGGVDF